MTSVPAWYANFFKPVDVFSLPYLVSSDDKLRAALAGDIGHRVEDMAEKAGFKVFGYWLIGARHIVNRIRPVHKPADVVGLKLRTMNSEVYMTTFRKFGANPIAMDASELYLAVQQGVMDGFELALPDIVAFKFYEVAQYLSLDAHTTDFHLITTSPKNWAKFSAEEQQMIRQAMKKCMDWLWDLQPQNFADARKELEKRMKVNEITPENKKLFVEAARPVWDQMQDSLGGKEWVEQCAKALA